MGCGRSRFEIGETTVFFSEGDDDLGCLCTFPHNHHARIGADTILSLAMLGAAVRLLNDGGCASGWQSVRAIVGGEIEAKLRVALGVEATHPQGIGEAAP